MKYPQGTSPMASGRGECKKKACVGYEESHIMESLSANRAVEVSIYRKIRSYAYAKAIVYRLFAKIESSTLKIPQ